MQYRWTQFSSSFSLSFAELQHELKEATNLGILTDEDKKKGDCNQIAGENWSLP